MTDTLETRVAAIEKVIAPPPPPLPAHDDRRDPGDPSVKNIADLEGMAADLLKLGIPIERVNAALKVSGLKPVEADTRSKAEVAFDEVFAAPANPNGYRIEYFGRTNGLDDPAALAAFDAEAKDWLHAISFPVEIGNSFMEVALDAGQKVTRMTDADRKNWEVDQEASLTRFAMKRGTTADDMRKIADTVLEFAPKGLTDTMRKSGALADAQVIMLLTLQGERMAARRQLRS